MKIMEWIKGIICKDCLESQQLLLCESQKADYIDELAKRTAELRAITEPNALEEKENSKYPKTSITYAGRALWNKMTNYKMDVKTFLNPSDCILEPIAKGFKGTDDQKALKALKWVINNVTYTGDDVLGMNEFWQYPIETYYRKRGDCEDGAMLLHQLCLLSGIPYWKLRMTAGDTPYGGHAYLTYYYTQGDYWVSLDWCYYPSIAAISKRKRYSEDKLYGGVWFSWNLLYAFSEGTKARTKGIKGIKLL